MIFSVCLTVKGLCLRYLGTQIFRNSEKKLGLGLGLGLG